MVQQHRVQRLRGTARVSRVVRPSAAYPGAAVYAGRFAGRGWGRGHGRSSATSPAAAALRSTPVRVSA